MTRRRRWGARSLFATMALVSAAVLAGCGGAASTEPSAEPTTAITEAPSATPEPTPTPTPEPTIDVEALGEAYLALASALFEAQTAGFSLLDSATTEDEWFEANMALEIAYRGAADHLAALEFPPELQADVDELHEVLTALADEFKKAMDDSTYDNSEAVNALTPQMPAIGGRIREVLGLPPPITPAPD